MDEMSLKPAPNGEDLVGSIFTRVPKKAIKSIFVAYVLKHRSALKARLEGWRELTQGEEEKARLESLIQFL